MATTGEVLAHGLNGRFKILRVNNVIHAHITPVRSTLDYYFFGIIGVLLIIIAIVLGALEEIGAFAIVILVLGGMLSIVISLHAHRGIIDLCITASTITYKSTLFGVSLRSREYAVSGMGEWKITEDVCHNTEDHITWTYKVWQFTYQGRGVNIIPTWTLEDISEFVKHIAPYLPESVQPKQLHTPSQAAVP